MKRIVCILLVFLLTFARLPARVFGAEIIGAGIVGGLVWYTLSNIGALIWGADDEVHALNENEDIYLYVDRAVNNALSDGSIKKSDGNYYFSNDYVQNIYQILNNYNNTAYYTISDFSNFKAGSFDDHSNAAYRNYVNSYFDSTVSKWEHYLEINYCYTSAYDIRHVSTIFMNMSDYPYMVLGASNGYNSTLTRYNSSVATSSRQIVDVYMDVDPSSGSITDGPAVDNLAPDYELNYYETDNYAFPIFTFDNIRNYGNVAFFSNKPITFFPNVHELEVYLNGESSGNSDGTVQYIYNPSFAPVSEDVITNYNWKNIYNNYVGNVGDEVTNYYNIYNEYPDNSKLIEFMTTFLDAILNAILNGNGDLDSLIDSSVYWLKKIYTNQNKLYDLIATINLSGGGNSGGTVDLDEIVALLTAISNNLDNVVSPVNNIDVGVSGTNDKLQSIYVMLSNLYDSVSTNNTTNNYTENYMNVIVDLDVNPDGLTNLFNKGDVCASVLRDAVPLCYIFGFATLLNSLSATPEPPAFEVPFDASFVGYSDGVSIDFGEFDATVIILNAIIMILFIIALVFLSFKVFAFISNIF